MARFLFQGLKEDHFLANRNSYIPRFIKKTSPKANHGKQMHMSFTSKYDIRFLDLEQKKKHQGKFTNQNQ